MPYYTRKYLLGHALPFDLVRSRNATAAYTHVDDAMILESYATLLQGAMAPTVATIERRLGDER